MLYIYTYSCRSLDGSGECEWFCHFVVFQSVYRSGDALKYDVVLRYAIQCVTSHAFKFMNSCVEMIPRNGMSKWEFVKCACFSSSLC